MEDLKTTSQLVDLKERACVIARATAQSLLHEAQKMFEASPTVLTRNLCTDAMFAYQDAAGLPGMLAALEDLSTVEWFVRRSSTQLEGLALQIAEIRDGGK